jgi:hypothetical protein
MNRTSPAALLLMMLAALIAVVLFKVYQNPLMGMYLAEWALC